MTITQTINIPPQRTEGKRQLTIDIPCEIPAGKTILTFTPASSVKKKMTEAEEIEYINRNAERLNRETMDILSYQNWFSESEVSDS